jgi:hypothetical protein
LRERPGVRGFLPPLPLRERAGVRGSNHTPACCTAARILPL